MQVLQLPLPHTHFSVTYAVMCAAPSLFSNPAGTNFSYTCVYLRCVSVSGEEGLCADAQRMCCIVQSCKVS